MSETGVLSSLPRPVVYLEKPQHRRSALDDHAARLMAYAKVTGARLRARKLSRIVTLVKALDAEMSGLDQATLVKQARVAGLELRSRNDFPAEHVAVCFAAIRELSGRQSGRRHYGVQMMGAYAMLRGCLAQMATGEGKTLTAALAAATAALAGIPVHVVTVNDYLAKRDAELTSPIYNALGLTVGVVAGGMSFEDRRTAYAADITYCTNKELAFDYLRDRIVLGQSGGNLRLKLELLGSTPPREAKLRLRGLHFAIVDEADSVLVDEARTPLIISSQSKAGLSAEVAADALDLAASLLPDIHYAAVHSQKRVALTPAGRETVRIFAEARGKSWHGVVAREEFARQALSALLFFNLGEQYIVVDGKVQIVDEQTGRVMPDRAWSDGLHQMIEVKESCIPTAARTTIARMTYQRFFRRYRHLSGMTGTAMQVGREFWSVYRLSVVAIPTHRPVKRVHLQDHVLPDDNSKWSVVMARITELHGKGVPVLVGTRSVASSLAASARLTAAGLTHSVLNAEQDKTEAEIIAIAGEPGRITVATNMAGRGTDIHLGNGVEALGGLHVIMVERHEARRIDDQLAGRSGRQGQPGCFQAILSLDDPLLDFAIWPVMRKLCRASAKIWGPTPSRWLLRHAQRRAERIHAGMRRDLLKSDENQSKTLAFSGRPE